jgi:hypothetical protein
LIRASTPAQTAVLAVTAFGVLFIGIFPGFIYNLAMTTVKIFPGL